MAIRIRINGSSIEVTDLDNNINIIKEPSKSVWYVESVLKNDRIQLYDSDTSNKGGANLFPFVRLSEAVDSDGVSFTENSFRDFVFNNLGYSNYHPTGETFVSRILELPSGVVYYNKCANI